MSLLDDAKRLYAADPYEDDAGGAWCLFCGEQGAPIRKPHAPDCPWLSMPKIVAVLEAAERLVAVWQLPPTARPIPGSMGGFDVDFERGKARYREIQQAETGLEAALKREVAVKP